jgi:hypothetical protein
LLLKIIFEAYLTPTEVRIRSSILHFHHLITFPSFSRSSRSLVHLLGDHEQLIELPSQRLDILLFYRKMLLVTNNFQILNFEFSTFVVRRMPVMTVVTGASYFRVPIS